MKKHAWLAGILIGATLLLRASGVAAAEPRMTSDSMEMRHTAERRMEIERAASGDVTFVLQVTDNTLGLDRPSAETLKTLDVSLFMPDGTLFRRQKINGTRMFFQVPSGVGPDDGLWSMEIHEAKGATPHQLLVALCTEGLHELDAGDPGYDPNAGMASLNLISSDKSGDVLRGASHPGSVDVFLGGRGGETYVGGTGNNLYIWETGGGRKTIVNDTSRAEPSGVLWIGDGVDLTRMSMTRSGNDLVIALPDEDGAPGSVTVQGWYAGNGRKLAMVSFWGWLEMTAEEVESVVDGGGKLTIHDEDS